MQRKKGSKKGYAGIHRPRADRHFGKFLDKALEKDLEKDLEDDGIPSPIQADVIVLGENHQKRVIKLDAMNPNKEVSEDGDTN